MPDLRSRIHHATFGRDFRHADAGAAYLDEIESVAGVLDRFKPDLILYQAGADPHLEDPLGGILSSSELRQRDRRVFQIAKGLGIPLAWDLAGGYQRGGRTGIDPVIAIHMATFEEAARVFGPLG